MKKLLGLLILMVGMAHAQELDTLAGDTLEKVPPSYFAGAYADLGVRLSPNPAGLNLMSHWGFGVQYNRWLIGFTQFDFEGTIQQFVIFPNVLDLDYRYGGPNIGFQFVKKKWVTVSINISHQWGDMVWQEKETGMDFFRDKIRLTSASISFEVNRVRYAKPYLVIGYQSLNNLSLPRVEKRDFSGVFFGVGLRTGYFNQ